MRNASWLVVVFAGAACAGCSGSPSATRATEPADDAGTDAGLDATRDAATAAEGAAADTMGAYDGPVADAKGAYDGPVADAACPGLPGAGTWQNISPPGSHYATTYTGVNAVVVRPDDPAIVYTGVDSNGIFKSTDCGATWALVNTGTNVAAMSSGRPWSMAIDPVTPDVMYAVEGYGTSGLWKSSNAGVDWEQILTPNITSAFYSAGQITGFSMDPGDHTHLVIESHGNCASGSTCAAESSDSGGTWTLIDMSAVGGWAEDSTVAIVNRTTWLYCGLFSGLFRTADEGVSWQAVDAGGALPSCNYYEPYVWQAASGSYYVPAIAYAGAGLLQSPPDDTSSWTIVANSPQGEVLTPTGTSLVLAKTDGTYWIASQSDPTTWKTWVGPPVGMPSGANLGAAAYFMAYDRVHHALYVSTFSTGLWETVME